MRRSVLAVALAFALAGCSGSASAGPGPLTPAHAHGFGVVVPVGHTYTDGLEVLELHGKRKAVIDAVRMVPGKNGAGLKLIGVQIASPARRVGSATTNGWPVDNPKWFPASSLGPAIGATISPGHKGWDLLLGIKVTKPGYLVRRGIVVDYHIGDQHYIYYDPAWAGFCTHPMGTGGCPAPHPPAKG